MYSCFLLFQKAAGADIGKLFELGNEPDRRFFLERLFSYLDERGTPLTSMPTISKQPLDLFRLYLIVRDKGGMLEVILDFRFLHFFFFLVIYYFERTSSYLYI